MLQGFAAINIHRSRVIDWSTALESNRRWLETVVRARLGDGHAAEDILQELALVVLRQTDPPSSPEMVAPWLYRVALRKVINYRRTLGRQKKLLDGYSEQVVAASCQTTASLDDHWLLLTEVEQRVKRAMRELPESDREILLLKYTEEWSYRDLANHLGVTLKTIEYRLLRARKALRRQLKKLQVEL